MCRCLKARRKDKTAEGYSGVMCRGFTHGWAVRWRAPSSGGLQVQEVRTPLADSCLRDSRSWQSPLRPKLLQGSRVPHRRCSVHEHMLEGIMLECAALPPRQGTPLGGGRRWWRRWRRCTLNRHPEAGFRKCPAMRRSETRLSRRLFVTSSSCVSYT